VNKTCKKCLQVLDLEAFYKEPRVKDGRTALCIACCNERDALWRIENPEQNYNYQRDWRLENKSYVTAKGRAWRIANRERSNTYSRKWARNNREKVKTRRERWVRENRARVALYAQERRAREAGAYGVTTPEQLQARIDFYGGRCWVCRAPFEAVDHTISLNKGGTNWPANLRPICTPCNSSKGDKHPLEFLESRAATGV
jgi:5-methylcytosine-specific restriction endonuclease McrA